MSLAVALCIAWVFASTLVAFLPLRLQYLPGMLLLLSAPALIIYVGASHGWIWVLPAALAFLSMYRNPLRYLWQTWRDRKTGERT